MLTKDSRWVELSFLNIVSRMALKKQCCAQEDEFVNKLLGTSINQVNEGSTEIGKGHPPAHVKNSVPPPLLSHFHHR